MNQATAQPPNAHSSGWCCAVSGQSVSYAYMIKKGTAGEASPQVQHVPQAKGAYLWLKMPGPAKWLFFSSENLHPLSQV